MPGIMHSLATRTHALYYNTSDTGRHTAHAREVRNLFVGRRATAVAPYPTQPILQVKTISVALPTARQNPFWCLSRDPAFLPPNSDTNSIYTFPLILALSVLPNVVCFVLMSYANVVCFASLV